ncbi:adenylate/guanylate cyclase domain-containing protein [Cyanobium sp. Morenito 9A2]|uniref:adenylate/guanylate cyclase domain-containing protein n=1 Tax=Cyanobium sp. Morenito 9A2 TaxID=2823718 RepID=UPI0020CD59E7|nr:adenylate/guanylate cyclase domain-containing protein [Cyanobium sp. Morenito 9A2]MCP9850045.1 adenylate/guanylate cyclase domain-containing protein [Cyanobium sp. Morenito 9A2]
MRRPPLWGLALLVPLLLALPALRSSPVGVALVAADAAIGTQFFRLRGVRPSASSLVVLAVDGDSLALDRLLGPQERRRSALWRRMGPWPWPRALQAELAAAVLERGAARVVFNVVYAQPSRFGAADDRAFSDRLAPWRDRVILASAYGRQMQDGVERAQLDRPIYAFPRTGLTTLLQSPQGLTDSIPGSEWLRNNLESFAPPRPDPLPFVAAGRRPPPQPLGINYPGPAGVVSSVPAWRVLEQPAGFWRGRTVLLGATAPELGGLQETAFGPQSGTEVQAAALASVSAGVGLWRLEPTPETLLLLGWGVTTALLLRRSPSASAVLAAGWALAAVALALGGLLWAQAFLVLPWAALIAMPLVAGSVRGGGQWLRESRERAYLHQVLARRISPTLLKDILREPGPLWTQVGGSRADCVVLFTDLVGFTPLSAQLEPPALFALLNNYFEAIATAVIEEQGLLDKFIGDSLMAEFGVPRSRGDRQEALAAARAALAMRASLGALNATLERDGRPTLRQGIGLHFGEVIAGNLGSSQRLEFTVVGSTVNVASRLEGLTRRFPEHSILISGELLALLGERAAVVPLGAHTVKGWPTLLEVYALEGLRPER